MKTALAYIDYYVGTYSDTIRIATKSKEWIVLFRDQIRDVFEGVVQNFDVCQMPHIKCFDSICSLELIKVKKSTESCIVFNRADKKTSLNGCKIQRK